MIIERFTWKVGHQQMDEFIKSVKAMVEKAGWTTRICTFMFGPMDIVIHDLEFETEEDRQKYWTSIDWSLPEITEFKKKYADLAESGATHELLRVH
jgi:hypothetical protein